MEYRYNSHEYSESLTFRNIIESISLVESICLMFFAVTMVSVILISVWSSILLATGNTQGGGPLGMIANTILRMFN
jgi:hypothetical protein